MSSENIDAFAQEYFDRAHKRREILAKKLADTSPRRKRIVALGENQVYNIPSTKTVDDDSPNKRQCTREDLPKADTPAIPSVRSRLNNLVSERKNWDDCPLSADPVPPSSQIAKTPPARDVSPTPVARKMRLAHLAQNISSWEDDPKHVIIKKEEKPKKVWEPPRPTTTSTVTESSPRGRESSRKVHNSAPSKPDRTYEHVLDDRRHKSRSPIKGSQYKPTREEGSRVTSSLTVTLGNGANNTSNNASPVHPLTGGSHSSPTCPKNSCITAPESVSARNASPVKPGIASRLAALQQDANKRRDSFEPSAQPVAARLAGWQERVRRVENEKKTNIRTGIPQQTKSVMQCKATIADDSLPNSVQSTMADWEQKIQKEVGEGVVTKTKPIKAPFSPAKNPAKPPMSASPIKSPAKLAPAAKTIQDKLQLLQESWKQNEIAEKFKQQRQAELAQLENRWKNGVLNEERYTVENEVAPASTDSVTTVGGIPPPPPLPSNNIASPQKQVTVTEPSPPKSTSKTPKPVNEDARKKIRADFENKLKTLGFEIESKSEMGKVAILDLKEQREKDRLRKEAEKCHGSPKKTPVKITEETMTSCKFGNERVSTEVKVAEGETPVDVQTKFITTPGRSSLYSVVRKQTNGRSDMLTPNSTRQTPTKSASSAHRQFHDSFSSDDTSSDEESVPPTTVTVTTKVERGASTASDYSTSQTEATTQSDEEYSGAEYSIDETEATTQSDCDDEMSADESESNGDISDLLEEAMDDTVSEPSPQYVARKLPPEAHPGHPDHKPDPVPHLGHTQPTPVQLRHPPPKYPRQNQQPPERRRVAFTSPGGSTYRSDSSGSEKSVKREIIHSIDNYRSSANIKTNAPEPCLKIIRRSQHFDSDDSDVPHQVATSKSQESVGQHVQELQELVNLEQNIIKQASNALNQCLISNPVYAGPDQAIECHRLLLQACKKREAYMAEMERLRSGRHRPPAGPKGSLTISNIQLPLKRDFVARLNSGQVVDTIHFFIILFRQGTHVIFTQMVSTNDELINSAIQIPNMLPMIEIHQDFRIDMEIYCMSVAREIEPERTPKKKKNSTPKKFMSGSRRHIPAFHSAGGPSAVSTSNFTFIAGLPITLSSVNKTCFGLNRVPFSSPLNGTVNMKLTCLLEALVEEKGFLTMFEDVSGLGNWHRRWCVLKHNVLAYWKYPDDSKFKEPIGSIDLKACITDDVGLIPRDVCARPNTFELVTVRRQQHGDFDTLVSQCYNTMTTTKHWLSADTKEDRFVWCHKLNEALRNLRMWNPDALRPIRHGQKLDTGV